MYLDKHISVYKLKRDSGNISKESYQLDLGLQSVDCNVQPASPEFTAIAGGVFARTWRIFTTTSGIAAGDRLTVSGGSPFTSANVSGVQAWAGPLGKHWEVVALEAE